MSTNLAGGIAANSGAAVSAATSLSSQVEGAANSDVVVNVVANAGSLESFTGALQGVVENASGTLNQLPGVSETAIGGMANAFTNGIAALTQIMTAGITGIKSMLASVSLYDTGGNIMDGLNRGLQSKRAALLKTAKSIATSIKTEINKSLEVRSPSRVMMRTGKFTGEGLIIGIGGMVEKVRSAAAELGEVIASPIVDRQQPGPALAVSYGGYEGLSAAEPMGGDSYTNEYISNRSTRAADNSKKVYIQNLIGSVTVRDEADEDRLADKIIAKLADEAEEAADVTGEEVLD
jgi:hypothetical protein